MANDTNRNLTKTLGLVKPMTSESVMIADLNSNFTEIDDAISKSRSFQEVIGGKGVESTKIDEGATGIRARSADDLIGDGTFLSSKDSYGDDITVNCEGGIKAVLDGEARSITFSHVDSSPIVGTKGSAYEIPIISWDAQGHIKSVSTTNVYPPTEEGEEGEIWVGIPRGESEPNKKGAWAKLTEGTNIGITYPKSDNPNGNLVTISHKLIDPDRSGTEVGSQYRSLGLKYDSSGHIIAHKTYEIYPPKSIADSDGLVWIGSKVEREDGFGAWVEAKGDNDRISVTSSLTDGIIVKHENYASVLGTSGGSKGSQTKALTISYDGSGHISGITESAMYPPTTGSSDGNIWVSDGMDVRGKWVTPQSGNELTLTSKDDVFKIDHNTSGVISGSYGSSKATPVISVNEFGHVTSISSTPTYPPTSAGTKGDILVSNGGTDSPEWASLNHDASLTITSTSDSVTFAHDTSTIGGAKKGGDTKALSISYDEFGHIRDVEESTVYPPTDEGVEGQIWISQGKGRGEWGDLTTDDEGRLEVTQSGDGINVLHKKMEDIIIGTYGSDIAVPELLIDSYGHIVSADRVTIYPPINPGESGQIWVSQGEGRGEWRDISTDSESVIDISKDTLGVKVSHKKSNVGEVSKGGSTEALTIDTDMYGHIFSIKTSTMYPPVTIGETGQIWISQGEGRGNWGGITSSTSKAIGVTQNKSGVDITHAKSALAAGDYGGNSSSPVITTDEFGHITHIDSVSVFPPIDAGTVGQVWVSRGSERGNWAGITSGTSGVISIDSKSDSIKVSHVESAQNSTTKGGSNAVPIVTTDEYGHITALEAATIYPPVKAGTEGQVWVSQGVDSGEWKGITSGSDEVIAVSSDKDGVKVSHKTSGATVDTKGSDEEIPIFTIDEYGHITTLSSISVYPPTTKGEAGQIWSSGGAEAKGVWINPSDLSVGHATNAENAKVAEVAKYAETIRDTSGEKWNVGTATKPIYFSEGNPFECTYELKADVLGKATSTQDGLMSKEDKSRLDSILFATNDEIDSKIDKVLE